jgi:hypothetical protein
LLEKRGKKKNRRNPVGLSLSDFARIVIETSEAETLAVIEIEAFFFTIEFLHLPIRAFIAQKPC